MTKETPTDYPILEAISQRWSPRAFSNKPISDDDLNSIFEAARWAASSFNLQPWRFILCKQGSSSFNKLLDVLMDGNKTWASQAPVLVLAASQTTLVKEGKPTRANTYAGYDLGQAIASLSIQATSMGIYTHQMAGFYKDKADKAFDIPENFNSFVVIALGYLGEADKLPDELAQKETAPRERKPQGDFVFLDSWN